MFEEFLALDYKISFDLSKALSQRPKLAPVPMEVATVHISLACTYITSSVITLSAVIVVLIKISLLAGERQALLQAAETLKKSATEASSPFEWVDGPLVIAMRQGDIILIDELNLADDAVLERLNRCLFFSSAVNIDFKNDMSIYSNCWR